MLQPREHSSWSKASKALSKETLLSIGYIITKYQRNTLALFVGRFLRKTKRITTDIVKERTQTLKKKQFKKSIMCWCWNSQSSLVKKIKEQPRRKMYYYYLLIKPKTHQVTSLNKSRWKISDVLLHADSARVPSIACDAWVTTITTYSQRVDSLFLYFF